MTEMEQPLASGTIMAAIDELPPLAAAVARIAHLVEALELLDTADPGLAARLVVYVCVEAAKLGPASPLSARAVACFGIVHVGRRTEDGWFTC